MFSNVTVKILQTLVDLLKKCSQKLMGKKICTLATSCLYTNIQEKEKKQPCVSHFYIYYKEFRFGGCSLKSFQFE